MIAFIKANQLGAVITLFWVMMIAVTLGGPYWLAGVGGVGMVLAVLTTTHDGGTYG